ncbi:unnamed protein product [Knipowitschia caucasica]
MKTYSLLFVLVLCPSLLLGQNVVDRYRNFINQHVNQGMSRTRCAEVMRTRRITAENNNCKQTNTFISSTTNAIKAVCGNAGTPYKNSANLRKSLQPFPVINCEQSGTHRPPRCEYRGRSQTVYVVLGCQDGYPVHYDRGEM